MTITRFIGAAALILAASIAVTLWHDGPTVRAPEPIIECWGDEP